MVRSVRGDLAPDALGVTDAHDHLLLASPAILGTPLDDEHAAIGEAREFQAAGGQTIVQWTPPGMGRRAGWLPAIGKCDILRAFDSMDIYGGGVDDKPAEGELTPPVVRASDAERNLVAERLGTACGEGRLTLTEFSDRVGEVYAARTQAELDRLVTDLPVAAERPIASVAEGVKSTRWEVHPLGGVRRTGRWCVRSREVFVTLLGGMHLDLRDAVLGAQEASLTVVALLGGVRIIVPPGVEVDVDGLTLLGGRHVEVDPNPPRAGSNAPRLRIRTVAVLGGVHVSTAVTAEAWCHRLGGVGRRELRRQRRQL